jgi:CcmD family protein
MKQTITEQFDANAAELLAQHNLMNAVYAVLTIIFVGILLYLFRLDRKISKIEKHCNLLWRLACNFKKRKYRE